MQETLWYLLAGGVVLCLPGITWWAWFPEKEKDILEFIAEVSSLSIAITALVTLGLFLFDVRLSPAAVGIIYSLLGVLAAAGLVYKRVNSKTTDGVGQSPGEDLGTANAALVEQTQPGGEQAAQILEQDYPQEIGQQESINTETATHVSGKAWIFRNVVLLTAFVLLLVWRFYQMRDLVLPAWVDSLHHTLIVSLILENGGLPDNLAPYMEVTFSYHYAYHVLTAAFAFLTRIPPEQAVLILGQVLNALVAVSVYRLGTALWADWRRAGIAALFVGFVFQMPAYYITWGRYTLLTGLVLLPLAMAVALDITNKKRSNRRLVKLAVLTGGVLLSHYFTALLLALFLIFLGLQVLVGDVRQGKSLRGSRWIPLTLASLTGALLASAWMVRMLGFNQDWVGVRAVLPAQSLDSTFFPNYLPYLWRMMGPRRNYVLLALALLGLVVSLRRPKTRAFGFWGLAVGLFSLPWGFHLSPFRPDHFVIVLFLPASLLVTDFIFTAWERLQSGRFRMVGVILAGAVIVSLLAWGLWETRLIINQSTVFTNQADIEAIEWVAANTPSEARFMTNVTHWQYRTYRGEDGGWWIMPLTRRETLLPPALYAMGAREAVEKINKFAETTSQLKDCSAEFWDLVQEAGVTHIYLVEGRGSLQPKGLEDCADLSLVYDEGGVFIYEVVEDGETR
jgi:small basic protein